jgi:hypothetical protein
MVLLAQVVLHQVQDHREQYLDREDLTRDLKVQDL